MKKIFLFLITAVALCGCEKDVEYINVPIPPSSNIRLYVANEGQFGSATASITILTKDGFVKNDAFRSVNKRPIGDVAQSMTKIGNNIYVAVNNSRKVEVVNAETFESVETIKTLNASIPTYITHLGGDSIAVSEKGNEGNLMIIDIRHGIVRDTMRRAILGVGSTNQMLLTNGKLFLTGSTLRVLSLSDFKKESMRTIVDSDGKSFGINGDSKIVKDKEGKIWVLNSGKLVRIDPVTEKVVKEYTFNGISIATWEGRLDISPDGERVYFNAAKGANNKRGIYCMGINDENLPAEPLFYADVRELYNMAVSPEETIFICDVEWSIARGLVREFSRTGELLQTFEAGIFPQYIMFR